MHSTTFLMHKDLQTITEIRQKELIILFNTVTWSTFQHFITVLPNIQLMIHGIMSYRSTCIST